MNFTRGQLLCLLLLLAFRRLFWGATSSTQSSWASYRVTWISRPNFGARTSRTSKSSTGPLWPTKSAGPYWISWWTSIGPCWAIKSTRPCWISWWTFLLSFHLCRPSQTSLLYLFLINKNPPSAWNVWRGHLTGYYEWEVTSLLEHKKNKLDN